MMAYLVETRNSNYVLMTYNSAAMPTAQHGVGHNNGRSSASSDAGPSQSEHGYELGPSPVPGLEMTRVIHLRQRTST